MHHASARNSGSHRHRERVSSFWHSGPFLHMERAPRTRLWKHDRALPDPTRFREDIPRRPHGAVACSLLKAPRMPAFVHARASEKRPATAGCTDNCMMDHDAPTIDFRECNHEYHCRGPAFQHSGTGKVGTCQFVSLGKGAARFEEERDGPASNSIGSAQA